jgi:hypothetical protein
MTLRGDNIANEFHQMVENYIEKRFGSCHPTDRNPPEKRSTMAEKLSAVKGMNDILPPGVGEKLGVVRRRGAHVMARYAYGNMRTPIVEPTQLFVKGLGEVTDIVEKEMYSFDRSAQWRTPHLRPENTAGVVRAMIEHNMTYDGGKRLYYVGPMFRHERPQARPLPPVSPDWCRGAGLGRPRGGCRADPAGPCVVEELGLSGEMCAWNSTAWASPNAVQHRAALIAYLERHAAHCWMKTPSAACTATRCASSTARTRPCRRSLRLRPELHGLPGGRIAEALQCRAQVCWTPTVCPTHQSAAGARAWTTTTSPCSNL